MRNKLAAIEHTCDVLASLGDIDADRLRDDPVVAAAVERLIGRLVDLAVDVNSHLAVALLDRAPSEYRESFDLMAQAGVIETAMAVRLKPSVGMRNVIVHEYVRLDLARVAAVVPEAIDASRAYVTAVARFLVDR
ncbi:MAG: type VII toxin-antitoxin system HepT family RNase toxin [Actinomycetota bacterium]